MTFSTLTIITLKEYLRIDDDEDNNLLDLILLASKGFIKSYTGLDEVALNKLEDIPMVILALSAEMYDNRQFTVDKSDISPVIKIILDMHSINLL